MAEELFCKNLKVHFKNTENVERSGCIRITIEMKTSAGLQQRSDLFIRITDDNNSFFLYNLTLSKDDFQQLKLQQDLLMEFSRFPIDMIGLLELCIKQEDKKDPQYVLEFCLSDETKHSQHQIATLKIMEINSFRHLQHLSLSLKLGNENDLNKYLASQFQVTKETLERERLSFKEVLTDLKHKLCSKESELQELCQVKGEQIVELKQQLGKENDKFMQTSKEMLNQHEYAKREFEAQFQHELEEHDAQKTALMEKCKSLENRDFDLRALIREKDINLDALNRELNTNVLSLKEAKERSDKLKKDFILRDNALKETLHKNESLESQVDDLKKHITHMSVSLDEATKSNHYMEKKTLVLIKKANSDEAHARKLSQELQKGNEIICKFKNELKRSTNKVKLLNEVVVRQERTVENKVDLLSDVTERLKLTSEEREDKDHELRKTKLDLDTTVKKLDEAGVMIERNNHLINYLNREINKMKTSGRPGAKNQTLGNHHQQQHNRPPLPHLPAAAAGNYAYSTPVNSYAPVNSQNIGVSTITTSRNDSSPLTTHRKNNKENFSPVYHCNHQAIDARYFAKSTDDSKVDLLTTEKQSSIPTPPGVISLKSYPKSVEPVPQHQQQNNVVSAYFSGRLPKSQ